LFEFGLLCFTTLFTMINPLGVMPLYINMTRGLTSVESRKIALKATITAAIILLIFAFTGRFIFNLFSISVHSLRIVGGVIFFFIGYEMLNARLSHTKHDDETHFEFANEMAITPLGIPMICGPGAITTVIIFMNESHTILKKSILISSIFSVLVLTFIILVSGKKIISFIGESGNKVLMRIMGLIVMVIAVEFFFGGLKPIIQDIIKIQ
jgi:multiple antibiotic resistance protein